MFLATILLATLPLGSADTPDLIVLKNGKEIECRVLFEDAETVVYTKKRKGKELPREEVESVQSVERSMAEFLEAFSKLPADDVAGLLDLASFCESRELFGEARNLNIRALILDPMNEAAWTKLGGVYSKRRGWRLRVRGRYLALEDLRERVSDWKNALELPTAHFLIKTDLAPERALDIAIDVERAYKTFYDLLGSTMRLYPFDEVPELRIYANEDDYERPPSPGDVVWYAANANILHVNATASSEVPYVVVSELSDLLFFNAFRRTVGRTGNVAPWARKGFSQAFGAAYRKDPGKASWDLSQPIISHFKMQAAAEDPLSLKEILRSSRMAYSDPNEGHLFSAQGYTLVYFLAHVDDGALRSKFGEYLISSVRGQGAATHFAKILDVDLGEFETRWYAYVREIAGM